jgi:hypothetical protein
MHLENANCEEDNVILWDVIRQAPHVFEFLNSCVERIEAGENKDILRNVLSYYQRQQ